MNRQEQLERQRRIRGLQEVFERSAATPEDRARHGQDPAPDPPPSVLLDESSLGDQPPPRARRARLLAERRPAIMLAVVALVSAAVASLITWLGRPVAAPVGATPTPTMVVGAEHSDPAQAATSGATPSGAAPSGGAASTSIPDAGGTIVVSVVGKVVSPGLVTLPGGSRVSDAISAAGGALPDADLTTVNLARKVTDGEQIGVDVPGGTAAGGPVAADGPVPAAEPDAVIVNINQADVAELDTLPGIGPVIAERIVAYRDENGPYAAVDDLAGVSGIGPAIIAEVRGLVTV